MKIIMNTPVKENCCNTLRRRFHPFLVLILVSFINPVCTQSFNFISWNIKDFGQSRSDQEIHDIAHLLRNADLIAIQEVVAKHPGGAQAVARLTEELRRMGAEWDYRVSDPTKSPSPYISERYAYIWKPSKVKLIGRPRLLNEVDDLVHREPYVAKFRVGVHEFFLLNYHSRTHDVKESEEIEVKAISDWVIAQGLENNFIWAGDFNLRETHPAFLKILTSGFEALVQGQPTTLKSACRNGEYHSLAEDNVYIISKALKCESVNVIDFIGPENCEDVRWKRNSISDHLPICIKFNYGKD
ncbi:MAG: endonuclease/exonuclease/phosphatase family protein [Saprospiraceae bacterium]|nr:endonuclease/exonuclease/phosphatase family protein [Candidatus Vicinibacter affinis]